jgi:hypothetical protein
MIGCRNEARPESWRAEKKCVCMHIESVLFVFRSFLLLTHFAPLRLDDYLGCRENPVQIDIVVKPRRTGICLPMTADAPQPPCVRSGTCAGHGYEKQQHFIKVS